ncbi:AGAP012273-PA [Anopheles gambiae str. PEST]|uniref:AGAP012273-PA n=1 Tax=Anopheles gambiae TaxID=7165 RepID=A7UVB5_ANOGA|nr:AGAP012273-PA [Anopheles gambiae str. PEST]
MSTPDAGSTGGGGGGAGGQLSATAVVGGGGAGGGGGGGGGAGGATVTTTTIPIDLASASKVLVRPEKTTMSTTTYRFGSTPGSQMRVVIPSSAAQQTFYRQPANIKQDATTTNRTQISTLPGARTVTQTASLTVSRPPPTIPPTTVSYHVSNRVSATPVVAANLQATSRATINGPIRITTPPIQGATQGGGNTTTYVQRQAPTVVPSRSVTSSGTPTAATIISQSSSGATTTLVPNFQMSTPLFRAGGIGTGTGQTVTGAPRARVVTQTTLSANHHQVAGVAGSTGGGGSGGGQSQAFVATLSAVLQGPRQVSTLLYTNNSNAQQYTIGPNQQRLALTTTLSPQRPQATVTTGIRPTIQRLPTSGIRVSTGSLNFRSPVLASTTVQNPPSGATGTAQIVNRLQTNLVNIQPLIVSNSRLPQSALQPGITIAQVGKLTQVATAGSGGDSGGSGSGNAGGNSGTTTLQTATGQQIVVSTGGAGPGGGGGGSPATAIIAGNLITANHPGAGGNAGGAQTTHQGQITQIVNVNAGQPTVVSAAVSSGQQQQIVTVSQAGGGSATTGTVIPLPLALTSARNVGGGGSNAHSPLSIVTGGIVRTAGGATGAGGVSGSSTSIASVLPIAKVTPQQQQTLVSMDSGSSGGGVTQHYSVASSGGVSGGPSLYIQTRPGATGATLSVVSSGSSGGGGAGTGGSAASATTFLPTSTFYYERLTSSPATSAPSSTAAVTISSTGIPVSSATFVQAVAASSSSSSTITTASAISGPVFSIPASSSVINSSGGGGGGGNTTVVTVAAAGNPTLAPYGSTGSFAIVQASPAGSGVGARTATLATGPIHGIVPASVQTGAGSGTTANIVSVSQPTTGGASSATTQIVPIRFHSQMVVDSSGQTQQIIVSSGGGGNAGSGGGPTNIVPIIPQQSSQQDSPQSSILRKRTLVETAGGTIKATPVGKDLTAALMAVERERQQHHHLVTELRDLANASPLHHSRPPSTDGSTTVSATSSPGLDEQEEEELRAQAYANRASNAISGDGHFKPQSPRKKARKQLLLPMTDGLHHHHHLPPLKSNSSSSSSSSSSSVMTNSSTSSAGTVGGGSQQYLNAGGGAPDDERMDTSGSGLVVLGNVPTGGSTPGSNSSSLGHHHANANKHSGSSMNNSMHNSNNVRMDPPSGSVSGAPGGPNNTISVVTARQNVALRKPNNLSLLQSYKQTWKSANNHFQRYTDVKQREERRPTVMDIASQSHILQKLNGWKIYHLSAQIEDLCDLESQAYGELGQMLQACVTNYFPLGGLPNILYSPTQGNMQRSKIIIDGINDARTQIMKIFKHKPHVSDIILRCASKRNFKKREKT